MHQCQLSRHQCARRVVHQLAGAHLVRLLEGTKQAPYALAESRECSLARRGVVGIVGIDFRQVERLLIVASPQHLALFADLRLGK